MWIYSPKYRFGTSLLYGPVPVYEWVFKAHAQYIWTKTIGVDRRLTGSERARSCRARPTRPIGRLLSRRSSNGSLSAAATRTRTTGERYTCTTRTTRSRPTWARPRAARTRSPGSCGRRPTTAATTTTTTAGRPQGPPTRSGPYRSADWTGARPRSPCSCSGTLYTRLSCSPGKPVSFFAPIFFFQDFCTTTTHSIEPRSFRRSRRLVRISRCVRRCKINYHQTQYTFRRRITRAQKSVCRYVFEPTRTNDFNADNNVDSRIF